MALTRSDKFIIAGAITLALVVVLGLAIWKKPQLFTGEAPKIATAQKTAPMPEQTGAEQAAPDIPEPPEETPPQTAAPTAMPVATPAAETPPSGETPMQAASPEETPAKEDQALFKGDETLDKMFADMHKAEDAAPAGEAPMPRDKPAKTADGAALSASEDMPDAAPKESAPESAMTPPETAAKTGQNDERSPDFPPMEEKSGAPAIKAEAMDEPEPAAKPAAKAKSAPAKKASKPAAPAPARGVVLGLTAEDRPGEFTLTVKTSAAVAGYEKFFMDNPPRVVLDLSGVWRYPGPWSLSGKGPLVRMIRLGKHADKFRVVLDLAPDADLMLRGAPEISRIPDGLVLKLQK